MVKRLRFLILFFIVVLLCQRAALANSIVFWHALPDSQASVIDELAAQYMEKNPSITIEIKKFANMEELHSALLTSDPAVLPDIAAIDSSWQEELKDASKIVPVEDSLLKSVKVALKMDTYPPLWKAACFDDALWTMPYFAYNYALVYDADAFAEEELKTPPSDWSQLYEYSKKLTDSEKGIYGFFIPAEKSAKDFAYFYMMFLCQAEDPEYTLQKEGIDGKNAELSLFYLYDLLHTHKIAQAEDVTKSPIFIGSPEDFIQASATRPNLKVARWSGKNSVGNIVLTTLAMVNKTSLDRENSWFFIYYLTEFPQLQKLALASPALPANKQVTLSPNYFQFLEKYPGIRTFLTLMGKGSVKPSMDNYESVLKALGSSLLDGLNNKKPIKSAVLESMETVNSVVNPEVEPSQPTGENLNVYDKEPSKSDKTGK